jgi:diadenosine tetraphosphate (Ap4A) HIT family hydrolase
MVPRGVQVVSKDVALVRLAEDTQRLLADGAACVMCALAAGRAELPFVAQNRHAVALLDRFAYRYGHLMVIPRVHVERLSELPWEIFSDVQRLTFEAAGAIDACLKPARVFTATLGAPADLPMTYAHYHVHVIPVYETDERARPARVLSWTEGLMMYDDVAARDVSCQLARHWPAAGAREASGFG